MAQRIVLSREQVRKLRELREGVGVVKDDETAEKKAANPQIQAPSIEESNHPPAEPGAFENVSRSKRLSGVANAAPNLSGHL
jgi:hypothetical protein